MGISSYNLPEASAFLYTDDLKSCRITTEAYHHLFNVLRIKTGEKIILSDGDGNWRLCSIANPTATKGLNLVALNTEVKVPQPENKVAVGFAITKPANSDTTVQKLTELRIRNIYPFISERTPIKVDPNTKEKLFDRFSKISLSAGEQSRNPYLSKIHPIVHFAELTARFKDSAAILQPGYAKIDKLSLEGINILLIGPEGGFSQKELETVQCKFSLGGTILRSETAAITVGAILTYLTG